MNAKTSVFVICAEAIVYLLLYNLTDCTFKYDAIYPYMTLAIMSVMKLVAGS